MSKVFTEPEIIKLLQQADSGRITGLDLVENVDRTDKVRIEYLSSPDNPCEVGVLLWLSQIKHSSQWLLRKFAE